MSEPESAPWDGIDRRKSPRLRQLEPPRNHMFDPGSLVARAQLWERFKPQACRLQSEHAKDSSCYIGITDDTPAPGVFFRVEWRQRASMRAVALTASPQVDREARLVFRVQTVVVANGSVSTAPTEALPVSYDASRNQFTIDAIPPIEEHEMAEFFLTRVRCLLNDFISHR